MDLESQSKQILEEEVLKIKVVQNVQPYKISLHMQPLYLLFDKIMTHYSLFLISLRIYLIIR